MSEVKDAFQVWLESTKDLGIKSYNATADLITNVISPPKLTPDDKYVKIIMETRNCSHDEALKILSELKASNTV